MPKRNDLKKVLVIGSGPIRIGQAAEFDFSGSQACKSLREEGIKTVLINSNPATIQTDPDIADIIYVEPLTPEFVARVIEKEKPDGILPTMGGQTGLNLVSEIARMGILDKYNVECLGTSVEAIDESEDRDSFAKAMERIDEPIPKSKAVNSIEEAEEIAEGLGYPVIVRPAYTLGGSGSGIAHDKEQLGQIVSQGIRQSIINQVLIEECVLGWYEYEWEVMRDSKDNCITVCSMENIDPMGIHTGESIVVAPSQTLSDKEVQQLRTSAIKVIRALKIEGGCNIQFAVRPDKFEYIIIEVNPRVSRSSALASKATGYPIARVAAKIAIGMTLDEIQNDITGKTTACFEPALDYVVTKIPRWPFDKFTGISTTIGTQMKSTGEVMAIGRSLEESLQKAIDCLDTKMSLKKDDLQEMIRTPNAYRLFYILAAFKKGMTVDEIHKLSMINKFFLRKIQNLPFKGKKKVFKMVDTCAAEFEAETPYFYSANDSEDEADGNEIDKEKVIILGAGPIRIGQGIEFDYCCVHSVLATKEDGYYAIMINNNPETVSTDYDISDRLYFEPLNLESVLRIVNTEKPKGVIVQMGGQTSINLAEGLEKAGVPILGTSPKSIDLAEDRKKFGSLCKKLGIPMAEWGTATTVEGAIKIANRIKYPVLVRPSYVLGGRAMQIVYSDDELKKYMEEAVFVSPKKPVLIDQFLEDAIEVDVDAIYDGLSIFIGGVMEHTEFAGVHSGDSSCVVPPHGVPKPSVGKIKEYTLTLAHALKTRGLINIQFAVKDGKVYVLEANPRASRTVPFLSKAIGVPLAKIATKVMLGKSLHELGYTGMGKSKAVAVKNVVFPFLKFPELDPVVGPEMKSTGEVMGIDTSFGSAFYKSQVASGNPPPTHPVGIFVSVRDKEQKTAAEICADLSKLGHTFYATRGTARELRKAGVNVTEVKKISDGHPNIIDSFDKIELIVNTPEPTAETAQDEFTMRRAAIENGKTYVTTMTAFEAMVDAIKTVRYKRVNVNSLGEYHQK